MLQHLGVDSRKVSFICCGPWKKMGFFNGSNVVNQLILMHQPELINWGF